MKIHLTLDGRVVPATLADTEAAREFAAMLPLTVTMHDLFRREKFGPLPRAISRAQTHTQTCAAGTLVCWTAGPDLAVLYREDGQPLSGGFHVLGHIAQGLEALARPGPIEVTLEIVAPVARRPESAALQGA